MAGKQVVAADIAPEQLQALDLLADECRELASFEQAGVFSRALAVSQGITRLKDALTPAIMKQFMSLQGNPLGFCTDRDRYDPDKPNRPLGYPEEDVKNCLVEAMLRGAYPVGNEMNIISSRAYLTLGFFKRKLYELPGLTDICLFPGVPVVGTSGALVSFIATWTYHDKKMRIDRILRKLPDNNTLDERIPVRVNKGMGPDAILGKAERKIRAQIYSRCTGTVHSEDEPDENASTGGFSIAPPAGANRAGLLADKLRGGAEGEKPFTEAEVEPTEAPSQSTPEPTKADNASSVAQTNQPIKSIESVTPPSSENEGGLQDLFDDIGQAIDEIKTKDQYNDAAAKLMKNKKDVPELIYVNFEVALKEKAKLFPADASSKANDAVKQHQAASKKKDIGF